MPPADRRTELTCLSNGVCCKDVKSAGHVTLLTLYSAHLALQAEDISGLLQLLDGFSVNSLQLLDAARSLLHLRQEGLRGHKFYTPRLSLP